MHTARSTLSTLRPDDVLDSSELVSVDFTRFSAASFYF